MTIHVRSSIYMCQMGKSRNNCFASTLTVKIFVAYKIMLYLGRDKLAIFTITVYVNIIVYMYLYIDARAQVFSAI